MRLWGRGDWRRGEHLCTHVKRMAKRHGGTHQLVHTYEPGNGERPDAQSVPGARPRAA